MTGAQIIAITVFFGFLVLLSVGFNLETGRLSALTNQSDGNLTFLNQSSGVSQVVICDFKLGEIPILTDFLWGVDCVAQNVGFLFSFGGFRTTIPWLQIIFAAIIMAIVFVGVKLLRGGG